MRKIGKRTKGVAISAAAIMAGATIGTIGSTTAYAETAPVRVDDDIHVESPIETFVRGLLGAFSVHVESAPSPSVYKLNECEWATVQAIQEQAQALLDGNVEDNSTIFEVSGETAFGDVCWTADDLGAEPVVTDGEGKLAINPDAVNPALEFASARVSRVFQAMLNENPARLAWTDKTQGLFPSIGWSASREDNRWVLRISKLTIQCAVSSDCRGSGEYTVSDEAISRINAAVSSAQGIVDEHESESLYDRLNSYAAEIMALTSYDTASATTPNTPYGDPWQLTSVLDGDVSTKSVCEGYSKTFRLLTELSQQSGGETILVAGNLVKPNGKREPHMWNVVSTPRGNYLIDVTNSENGTAGQNGELLFGVPASGSVEDGYTFALSDGRTLSYEYDEDTLGTYTEEALTLATQPYSPVATYAGLDNMTATIGGEPFAFDPQAAPYSYTKTYDGYGEQTNTAVNLTGYDTSMWSVTGTNTETHTPLPSALVYGDQFDYYTTRYGVTNTYTLTSLYPGEDGEPLTRTYSFTQLWWTKTDVPHVTPDPVATYSGLDGLAATIGGDPFAFDPQAAPYSYTKTYDGYGEQTNTSVALSGYDTGMWAITGTDTQTHVPLPSALVYGDQFDYYTTRYGVTNTYTLTSLYPGEDGTPLTRTYSFTQLWWTKTDVPHATPDPVATYSGLDGMTATIGGEPFAFDPQAAPYEYHKEYDGYGQPANTDVVLSGYDMGMWEITNVDTYELPVIGPKPSTGLPVEMSTKYGLATDFTFTSRYAGEDGQPLTRTYRFSRGWYVKDEEPGGTDSTVPGSDTPTQPSDSGDSGTGATVDPGNSTGHADAQAQQGHEGSDQTNQGDSGRNGSNGDAQGSQNVDVNTPFRFVNNGTPTTPTTPSTPTTPTTPTTNAGSAGSGASSSKNNANNSKGLVQTGDMTVVMAGGILFIAIGGAIVARHRMVG